VNGDKPVTLMNIATAPMRHLRKNGELPMLYESESEENNACTIKVDDTLLFFKNETHNHPTEIEPFGGASTCVGGAIRDPLSGRAYVYQAMRITGAGDPRTPIQDTIKGKLPQRKITVTAAEGFSSYGNQIGLATGYVKELYHPGYVAKRLEVGAVIGAAKESHVRREKPTAGDVVVVMGGRTGRDGIGGATGSSKTHGADTVSQSAAEVQKGNAPEERKLQRLFRNPAVTRLIKKCNDFGAGGASVAIGELADGIEIDLDALPVKYQGLDGTELAISESQERMAVVIGAGDLAELLEHCAAENIEAVAAAVITEEPRLVMKWRGQKIVDIARSFLDTNGAKRYTDVRVSEPPPVCSSWKDYEPDKGSAFFLNASEPVSQKGLVQRFDSSIGAGSVFMPFGGKYEDVECSVMAALIPTLPNRASLMAYGFDPYRTKNDPFGGSEHAVITSVGRLVAAGADLDTIHLSLQEYFPRVNDCPERWGKVFAAMLGAFSAQMGLKIAAIGGKDSMSGSFGDLDVPPTLISFACGVGDPALLVSNDIKGMGNPVYALINPADYAQLRAVWKKYGELIKAGKVLSADYVPHNGTICFEASEELPDSESYEFLEYTTEKMLAEVKCDKLESVFPTKVKQDGTAPTITDERRPVIVAKAKFAQPVAVIPVFPGTNCEYDTQMALERAGGVGRQVLVRNLTPAMLSESILELEKAVKGSQMLIFPGGFSGGDEPDGSAKFIVSLFRNERLTAAVHELLYERDGLILGICNGFQALVKLGLLPTGRVSPITRESATLTYNLIGRHQARYVTTRVASVNSPWLSECKAGEVYLQPVSHGEGRFTAPPTVLERLKADGQIAFQYADFDGVPSMDIAHNPNGSDWAIEGITSADGRILGKMAHSERWREHVAKNIPGEKFLPVFEGGVKYYK
jgi:phosphoribosylformylglycinamidine synthase